MALRTPIIAEHTIAAQIVFVGLLSAILTYVANELNYRNPFNLLWMIALPLLLGLLLNRNAVGKAVMAAALIGVSVMTVMTVGWLMGGI